MRRDHLLAGGFLLLFLAFGLPCGFGAEPVAAGAAAPSSQTMQKRWLFVWRSMNDPKEIDRMVERFPRAKASGYNGVVFPSNIPEAKAAELKQAAQRNGLDLVAIVMGGSRDRNYVEGILARDALFVVHGGKATLQAENPTRLVNAGVADAAGNHS